MELAGPGAGAVSFVIWSLLIVPVVVLAYLAFVVVAGKDTSEPAEPRGEAVYLHLAILVSLFIGLLAATSIVFSLSQLIGTNRAYPGFGTLYGGTGATGAVGGTGFGPTGVTGPFPTIITAGNALHPVGDAAARGTVLGAIIFMFAGAIFLTHWSRARRHREAAAAGNTNSGRIFQAYLNTAMLVAIFILLVAASLATYSVFEIAAPGVAQVSGRDAAARDLIPLLFFTGSALLIVDRHWRIARRLRGGGATAATAPGMFPPPAGPPEPPHPSSDDPQV